jgi:serine protease
MTTNLLLSLLACSSNPALIESPAVQGFSADDYAAGRVVVGFPGGEIPADISLPGGDATLLRELGDIGAVFSLPQGLEVMDAVEELEDRGDFRYVEPDWVRHVSAVSVDDPYRPYQWNLDVLEAELAWEYGTGEGVIVAVVDSGVSSGTGDGIGDLLSGYDFVNDDGNASDDNGHGTHVAGTIAQATDNGRGVSGLAWGASILPVKVMNASGSGFTSDIIAGINYAVESGADVINLSLGSSTFSAAEQAAVQAAWDAGVFVAAATGNDGAGAISYPAGYPAAVAVGATDFNDDVTDYSNRGEFIDLVAPGGDVTADASGDGYADGILQETFGPNWGYYFFEGTSMATPHVAAAAAMLIGAGATNEEALDALTSTAVDLGEAGYDTTSGWGRVDVVAALEWVVGDPPDDGGASLEISGVSNVRTNLREWQVSWSTSLPASGQVCTAGLERCTPIFNQSSVEHSLRVRGAVGAGFYVVSRDSAGNVATSEVYTFVQ